MEPIIKTGKKSGSRGYTLMEVMTVIAIVGILASIAIPSYRKSVIRAKESSLRHSLFVLRDVIDQYYADHGQYPDTLDDLTQKKYIRHIPKDPVTNSRDTWILIQSDSDEGGIYDVHSGSKKISLYGTPYNEW